MALKAQQQPQYFSYLIVHLVPNSKFLIVNWETVRFVSPETLAACCVYSQHLFLNISVKSSDGDKHAVESVMRYR